MQSFREFEVVGWEDTSVSSNYDRHLSPLTTQSVGALLDAAGVQRGTRVLDVATGAGYADYDQVWQSRSGPPQVPWLEPDVADQLSALSATGTKAVIVCPIGFVADHIEVVWDLDSEVRAQADELGIALARAATPNADPRFARLAVDLIDEVREGRPPSRVRAPQGMEPPPLYGFSVNGQLCTPECGKA